jgi:hypothetical protein
MQETLKIGTAALGGYVLGRTKKAKAAIGLALWLTGRGRPRDMARDQALKLLQSDRGQEMLSQMRGPVLAAGRQAALALVEAQAGRLTGGLQRRTEKLGTDVAATGTGAVQSGTDTAKRLTSRRRRDQEPEEEPQDEYADEYEDEEEEEAYEPEDEEEAYEPEDEAYEADEDEYADEELEEEEEPEEDEDAGEEQPEPEPKRPTRRRSRRAA